MEFGITAHIYQPRYNKQYHPYMYEGEITRVYKEIYKCPLQPKEHEVTHDVAVEGLGIWCRITSEQMNMCNRKAVEKIIKKLEKLDKLEEGEY